MAFLSSRNDYTQAAKFFTCEENFKIWVVNGLSKKSKGLGAEFPHGDLLQTLLPIPFFLVWGLDSFVFKFSTVLAGFVSLPFRLLLASVSLGLAFLLICLSPLLVFDETRDTPPVLDKGVFRVCATRCTSEHFWFTWVSFWRLSRFYP